MKKNKKQKTFYFLAALMFVAAGFFGTADAMQFKVSDDTVIDCDISMTYGASWRVSDRDKDKLVSVTDPATFGNINGDDANENFDQWSMNTNRALILADIDIRHKNFGLFIRPKAFYDHVYMSDNDNSSPLTNNALAGGSINDTDEWPDEVEDIQGRDAEILDLFAYGSFELGNQSLELRVGRQIIQWGESLLIPGITTAQAHTDYAAAVAVGTEVKEILLPSESVQAIITLTDTLGLAAYYQWKWEKNKLMEGGTFFSQADFMDDVDAPLLFAPGFGATRVKDKDASDSGQFGIALTWVSPWFNNTDFGLYYINYHDKNPTLNMGGFMDFDGDGIPETPTQYFLSYTEDIEVYAASVSTLVGDYQVSGEFSYRQGYVYQGAIGPGTSGNYWQAQTSWMGGAAMDVFAQRYITLGEIACVQEIGTPDDTFAWQYSLMLQFDWFQVLRDLDVGLNLAYKDAPSGTIDALGFTEGSASGSIGFDFAYKVDWLVDITYENRFNSKRNYASDRDTLSFKVTRTF